MAVIGDEERHCQQNAIGPDSIGEEGYPIHLLLLLIEPWPARWSLVDDGKVDLGLTENKPVSEILTPM